MRLNVFPGTKITRKGNQCSGSGTGKHASHFIDNYFDGELEFRNGFPVTSKDDKGYHGYGVKSMQMIAKKYGGDIRISVNNHTFSLQIMLPVK